MLDTVAADAGLGEEGDGEAEPDHERCTPRPTSDADRAKAGIEAVGLFTAGEPLHLVCARMRGRLSRARVGWPSEVAGEEAVLGMLAAPTGPPARQMALPLG